MPARNCSSRSCAGWRGDRADRPVPPATKLWFAAPVDLRLGFDGLSQLVRTQLSADPLSGHLFVFTNRSANRVKVLYWGGHGLCLWCSRPEAGRYHFPEATAAGIELGAAQFAMTLDGIDVSRVRRFKRYSPPAPTSSRYPSA
jgi:transposase